MAHFAQVGVVVVQALMVSVSVLVELGDVWGSVPCVILCGEYWARVVCGEECGLKCDELEQVEAQALTVSVHAWLLEVHWSACGTIQGNEGAAYPQR